MARTHPGTVDGLSALVLASTRAPDTAGGKQAEGQLARQIEAADLANLAAAFDRSSDRLQPIQEVAPTILGLVRQNPGHPKAARLLAAICAMTNPNDEGEPPAIYAEAADLIAEEHTASPDIAHLCEGLGGTPIGSPPWAGRFERHLRAVLRGNQDRWVRCTARLALASAVQTLGEDRQAEAEALFEQFCTEFDGKHLYQAQGIEQQLIVVARHQLAEIRSRALGKPAPVLTGLDLDDRTIKLSDYRGRVVLLSYWATWCSPCMKLIPHERDLVAAFQGQPFDIVGVNCDDDVAKARGAVTRNKMTWRSFRDQVDGRPTITEEWQIRAYPTFYLVDHHGIIRKRWVGNPPPAELAHMVRVLAGAARRSVPLDEMRPVVAALSLPAAKANSNPAAPPGPK